METDLLRTFTAVVRTRTASPPLPARLLVQDPAAAPSMSVGFCEAGCIELVVGLYGRAGGLLRADQTPSSAPVTTEGCAESLVLPAQPAPDLRALGVAARIIDGRCRLLGLIGPARFCGPDRVDNPAPRSFCRLLSLTPTPARGGGMALTCTARPRQSSPDRVTNPALCPPDLKTFWDRRDDLYQVGLPAWTLLSGEVHHGGVKKPAVNVLAKKDGVLCDGHQDGNRRQVAALRACRRHAGSARRMTPRGHHGARAACALLLRRAAQTAPRSACPQTAASRPSQPRGG